MLTNLIKQLLQAKQDAELLENVVDMESPEWYACCEASVGIDMTLDKMREAL